MAGGVVRRFHVVDVNRPPTDAEHSWGVAMLCSLLSDDCASARLLMAALTHDMAEHETGDMPSHVKRVGSIGVQLAALETVHRRAAGFEYSERLTDEEAVILNVADQLEGMLYCIRERRCGNRNVTLPYDRWKEWIGGQIPSPRLRQIMTAINAMWEEANGR
jgi:5'-deoxynucleotidase YfbR-like HD superfamily hydrolase